MVLLLLPFTLYIPFVQSFVKDIVIDKVSESTGYDITLDRILLKFPLKVEVDKVLILDQKKDTMIMANLLSADVKLLPLFKKQINIERAELLNGKYKMLSNDSSMFLSASVKECILKGALVDLAQNKINLVEGNLKGGNVILNFDKSKSKPSPPDTTASVPWKITAQKIQLQDVYYTMHMLPVIDEITAYVKFAQLHKGLVDVGKKLVDAEYISMDGTKAKYYTPTKEYLASYVAPPDTVPPSNDTTTWTVKGKKVKLTNSEGIYAMRGAKPQKGLDFNHIAAKNINFDVDSFYNRGMSIRVPLKSFSGIERSGISINKASGIFSMDSIMMNVANWKIATDLSNLSVDGQIGWGVFEKNTHSPVRLILNADLCLDEMLKLYPQYSVWVKGIPRLSNLFINMNMRGNLAQLNVDNISANLPKYASIKMKGQLWHLQSPKYANGEININGKFDDINFVKPSVLDLKLQKQVKFPPLAVNGKIGLKGSTWAGDINMTLPDGKVALQASLNNKAQKYDVDLSMTTFPMNAVVPMYNIGSITGKVKANGVGYNPLKKGNDFFTSVEIQSIEYNKETYKNISLQATVKDSLATLNMESRNRFLDFSAYGQTSFINDRYNYSLNLNISDLNLKSLGFSTSDMQGRLKVESEGVIDIPKNLYNLRANMDDISFIVGTNDIITSNVKFNLNSDPDTLRAKIVNNELNLSLNSNCPMDTFINKLNQGSTELLKQIENKTIDLRSLHEALPHFIIKGNIGGTNNFVSDYLQDDRIKYKMIAFNVKNDSIINMDGKISALEMSALKLDTITLNAFERDKLLYYKFHVGNKNGNLDRFAFTDIKGMLGKNNFAALFTERTNKLVTSFNFGVKGNFTDSTINVRFYPKNPIIGQRTWSWNDSNYVSYNYKVRRLYADLVLKDSTSYVGFNAKYDKVTNLNTAKVNISGIQIGEWINLSPLSPPINGKLDAEANLNFNSKDIFGNCNFNIADFSYNKNKIGDFNFNLDLELNPFDGFTDAKALMTINGIKALEAQGSVNDSTSKNPYNLKLKVKDLPLQIVNPFIAGNMANVNGKLDGEMDITGSFIKPILNGYLRFDSTTVNLPMFGSKLRFASNVIPVDSSKVKFNDFNIFGANNRGIKVDGNINLKTLDNPSVDLSMSGSNVQIIDSKYYSGSQIFGKGYVDINADVSGPLSSLQVNSDINVLPATNVTYVLQTDVNAISTEESGSFIKFTQFSDTTVVVQELVVPAFAMNLNVNANISNGSIINVNLSPDGKDKVQIQGEGELLYRLNPFGNSYLAGRYTIWSGFVRYSPPLISEKYFTFKNGSYVSWSGDMMNPLLSISATANQTANVMVNESSNRVNFLIGADISNTLNHLNVAFDLEAENNVEVQNELQQMTQLQRSTQAMNLMIYNTYTGMSVKSIDATNTNALYSFLSSQINNVVGRAVKGVDIKFGMNEYNNTKNGYKTNSMTYSYQISKTLFNDRFKVSVGGQYDNSVTNQNDIANNLFNDISIEYNLNRSGNIYVRVFRQLAPNNLFGSNIQETGGAFILRRRVNTLKNIFKFNIKKDLIGNESQGTVRAKENKQ